MQDIWIFKDGIFVSMCKGNSTCNGIAYGGKEIQTDNGKTVCLRPIDAGPKIVPVDKIYRG